METETMIQELRKLECQLGPAITFTARWSEFYGRIANRLVELQAENMALKYSSKPYGCFEKMSDTGKIVIEGNVHSVRIARYEEKFSENRKICEFYLKEI